MRLTESILNNINEGMTNEEIKSKVSRLLPNDYNISNIERKSKDEAIINIVKSGESEPKMKLGVDKLFLYNTKHPGVKYNTEEDGPMEQLRDEISSTLNESSSLKESEEYHYLTSANNYEDYGAEYIYNSETNTDVLSILEELKRYYSEALVSADEIIRSANHDPGVYEKDIEMLKFCSDKVDEMIDKMNSTWE